MTLTCCQDFSAICCALCLEVEVLTGVGLSQAGLLMIGKSTSGEKVSLLQCIIGCADADNTAD